MIAQLTKKDASHDEVVKSLSGSGRRFSFVVGGSASAGSSFSFRPGHQLEDFERGSWHEM